MSHACSVFIPWMGANAKANKEGKPLELVVTPDGGPPYVIKFTRTEWLRLIRGCEVVQAELAWEEDVA